MNAGSGINLAALGRYLTKIRRTKGWSLRKAAQKIGLAHTTICRLEKAEKHTVPELSTLQLIANAYEIPMETIFRYLASDESGEDLSPFSVPPARG